MNSYMVGYKTEDTHTLKKTFNWTQLPEMAKGLNYFVTKLELTKTEL